MACDPNSRDFLLYYARVLLREAKARRGGNVEWMLAGAARARRQAQSIRPAQADLFGHREQSPC
jgi:hypothetical protein